MTNADKPSFVEARSSKRIPVPKGSTALFRNEDKFLDFAYVENISETGMLICDCFPEQRYETNTEKCFQTSRKILPRTQCPGHGVCAIY